MKEDILISEKALDKALEYYYSLDDNEMYDLTEAFSKKQEFIISYLAGYQKELSDKLFEELLDASIVIWLAFKNDIKNLGIVTPEIIDLLDQRNSKHILELAKRIKKTEDETLDEIERVNDILNNSESEKEFSKLFDTPESKEIAEFLMAMQTNPVQPIIYKYITEDVTFNLEDEGYKDQHIQTVVEMLFFQMECYDLMINET